MFCRLSVIHRRLPQLIEKIRFQVALALRDKPKPEYASYSQIPILMLTAIHSKTPLRFTPDEEYLPVDDFVEKPLKASALLQKVEKLLEK